MVLRPARSLSAKAQAGQAGGLDFKLVLIEVPPPPTCLCRARRQAALTVGDPSPSWQRSGADERYRVFSAGQQVWVFDRG